MNIFCDFINNKTYYFLAIATLGLSALFGLQACSGGGGGTLAPAAPTVSVTAGRLKA